MPPTRAASLTKRRDSSQSKQGKLGFATRKSSLQTKKKKADLITPIPPKEKPTTTLPIAADAIVDPDPDPEQTSQYQDLDPEDKDILQESKRILRSRNVPKIHAKDLTHIDHILRDFDLNAQFGNYTFHPFLIPNSVSRPMRRNDSSRKMGTCK